jgi:hypothetical protein
LIWKKRKIVRNVELVKTNGAAETALLRGQVKEFVLPVGEVADSTDRTQWQTALRGRAQWNNGN